MDLYARGDRLLTLDTGSGLRWLDVPLANTYRVTLDDQLVTELGFRVANRSEVKGLLETAGVVENVPAFSEQNFLAVQSLIEKLGCTARCSQDGRNAALAALYDFVDFDLEQAAALTNIGLLAEFQASALAAGGYIGAFNFGRGFGNFLVLEPGAGADSLPSPGLTPAPVPGAFWMFACAAGVLRAFMRRRC